MNSISRTRSPVDAAVSALGLLTLWAFATAVLLLATLQTVDSDPDIATCWAALSSTDG